MINGIPLNQDDAVPTIVRLMAGYADALVPWAEATARRMLVDVNVADAKAWKKLTAEMGHEIQREIANAKTGEEFIELMKLQVDLIRSIPLDAATRVQELAIKGLEGGLRAEEMVAEIRRSGEVSEGRARTIARTETSRAASTFTQARAKEIGSPGYVWKTSRDGDVRQSHKAMQGQFVPWNDPPTLDGMTGHAGCLPNCRCYPSPVID